LEAREELLTIAQIAVGLAGVSGVVAAFLQRGGLPAADRLRFVALFATAFIALILAFVPIAFWYAGLGQVPLWRLSSAAMAFFGMVGLVSYPVGLRLVRASLAITARVWQTMLLIPTIANLLLQFANSVTWFWQPGFLPYLVGMLVWLYTSGLVFVTIVLYRPQD